jgi:hypothetical protein
VTLEKKDEEKNKKRIHEETLTGQLVEEPLAAGTTSIKRVKPRALIFRAHYQDFCKILDIIKSQFPEVELLYITTGPATGILKVTKSVPFEATNENAFFNVE